jgi:acyl-CoA synthetase (NDP forming)
VRDAVEAGARTIVVITAGLSETGRTGCRTRGRRRWRIARAAGVVLVGPNCHRHGRHRHQTSSSATPCCPPGDVPVLSQSGNLVLDLAALLGDRGWGVARFVSVGNQADLSVVDLMESCVDHDGTRAVALYAEDVVDGRAFVDGRACAASTPASRSSCSRPGARRRRSRSAAVAHRPR